MTVFWFAQKYDMNQCCTFVYLLIFVKKQVVCVCGSKKYTSGISQFFNNFLVIQQNTI